MGLCREKGGGGGCLEMRGGSTCIYVHWRVIQRPRVHEDAPAGTSLGMSQVIPLKGKPVKPLRSVSQQRVLPNIVHKTTSINWIDATISEFDCSSISTACLKSGVFKNIHKVSRVIETRSHSPVPQCIEDVRPKVSWDLEPGRSS